MTSEWRDHWQGVYASKTEDEVSWFQESPQPSIDLIGLVGAKLTQAVIDMGGGASRLVDHLVGMGYQDLTVLDLSAAALDVTKARLGAAADGIDWLVADASSWQPTRQYDIWHDRAAFHFLTQPAQQQSYMDILRSALRPQGRVIIGTFAPGGPEKCSGLPVARHDADSLNSLLGGGFKLLDFRIHEHVTPWGSVQRFQFSTFTNVDNQDATVSQQGGRSWSQHF